MLGLPLHGWENAMVIFAIIAACSAFVAGVATWAVVRLQRIEMAASKLEFDKYKLDTSKDISEANARAKEAELKLEELRARIAPRHLTLAQRQSLTQRMKAFPGVTFAMASSGDDNEFVMELGESLTAAGWHWINWPLGGIAIKLSHGLPEIGLDTMTGIETHVYDPDMQPIAIQLFLGLKEAGYKNVWVPLAAPISKVKHTLIIVIGHKE